MQFCTLDIKYYKVNRMQQNLLLFYQLCPEWDNYGLRYNFAVCSPLNLSEFGFLSFCPACGFLFITLERLDGIS